MHCSPNPDLHPPSIPAQGPNKGETPAWQSCGRIPARERDDFYEFLACNLIFSAVALATALVRSRIVEARQARRLAARIGLVRGSVLDIR
ncbi:hypothetical protein ID866_4579 [Astraeus odoratus]|nr:hypothetical protein ID866_4579 [Astraeus odoratus]